MRLRLLPQRSIRAKLMILATASGCVALLLACLGFMSNDVRLIHEGKLRQIAAQAELLGFNSSAALAVRDRGAAEQLLAALQRSFTTGMLQNCPTPPTCSAAGMTRADAWNSCIPSWRAGSGWGPFTSAPT